MTKYLSQSGKYTPCSISSDCRALRCSDALLDNKGSLGLYASRSYADCRHNNPASLQQLYHEAFKQQLQVPLQQQLAAQLVDKCTICSWAA